MIVGTVRLFASAILASLTAGIAVTPGQPAAGLESAGVKDSRFTFSQHPVVVPNPGAIGTFTDGPPGLTSGIIMSTGLVSNAVVGSTPNSNFGFNSGPPIRDCAVGTSQENVYYGMFVNVPQGVNAIRINYLFATEEPITGSPDSAIIYRDTIPQPQTAVTAQSPLPNTGATFGLSYARAGVISSYEFPVSPGSSQHLDFVLCDSINGNFDSVLLLDIVGLPLDPLDSSQLDSSQLDPAQLCSSQLDSSQLDPAQLGSSQLDSSQLGSSQLGSSQLGSSQLGSSQLDPAQLGSSQLDPAQLGSSQLDSSQFDPAQLCSSQLDPAQLTSESVASSVYNVISSSTYETTSCSTTGDIHSTLSTPLPYYSVVHPPVVDYGESISTTKNNYATQSPSISNTATSTSGQYYDVVITSVVTTITYTTVDLANPTVLVPAEVCTTLYFEDCHCSTQAIPTVPMVTYAAECDKCGDNEENIIYLTIPGYVDSKYSPTHDKPEVPTETSGNSPGEVTSPIAGDHEDLDIPTDHVSPGGPESLAAEETPTVTRDISSTPSIHASDVPHINESGSVPTQTIPGGSSDSGVISPHPSNGDSEHETPDTVVEAGAQGLQHGYMIAMASLVPTLAILVHILV
ncbi:hypothetical protein ACHAQH_006409 [Verticillium albo-atrum]